MPDILVAADEVAATELLHDGESALGVITDSGSRSLGPFTASYTASASLANGSVDLLPPNIIRVANCELRFSVSFSFSLDLDTILPRLCLPRICIPIPFFDDICTPRICIPWPTITVSLPFSDVVTFTSDFTLNAHLDGSNWLVDVVIVGIPSLTIGPASAAILIALGFAVAAAVAWIPFIGPFLAAAVAAITLAIGVAGVTGLLGPILTAFVSGLTINVYTQPRVFEILPASLPLDPAVNVNLDLIAASVSRTDEDELILTADISA
jgi:hypothetical protein